MNESSEDQLQAVVFDLDGLIANSEDLYELTIDEMLARRGKPHEHELRVRMMGRPVADSFQIMLEYHELPDKLDDILAEVREVLGRHMVTSLTTMSGAQEFIDKLGASGVPIAVATSGLRSYASDVLTRLGLFDRFRFILTAEDIRRGKPDPEIYLLAADRLGLKPASIMVLEDSGNGCAAGVASGAFTVAVPNRHTSAHDFTGARLIADTLADPRIIGCLRLPR